MKKVKMYEDKKVVRMSENDDGLKCNLYECDKYPECGRASGFCCATDYDDTDEGEFVTAEECNELNGYPLFSEETRVIRKKRLRSR